MSRRLRALHKWCALALVVLLILQGVSGLLIAHRESLERLGHRALPSDAGSTASLDVLVDGLRAEFPGGRLDRIIYPKTPGVLRARVYDEAGRLYVAYLDPTTGRILASGRFWTDPLELADRLHVSLLMGTTGKILLFIEAAGLSFLAVTGLWLWWPRGGRFGPALKVHWQSSSARFVRDLHVVPGALAAVVVLICALAAALLVAKPLMKPLVAMVAPIGGEFSLNLPATDRVAPVVTWQQGLEAIQQRFPDGRLRQVRLVGPEGRMLGVLLVARNEVNPRAHHFLGIDRMTGEVRVFTDASARPAGERLLDWFLPIHSGEIYGPARPVMLTVTGSLVLMLSATGLLMWWRQRSSRRRSQLARRAGGG
jgi:uncharacterized iron-regulated membrane protein